MLSLFLIAITTVIIAFTPLREYIPGYSSTQLKKQAVELNYRTDSLQQVIEKNERFLASIKKALTGDLEMEEINKDSIYNEILPDPENVDLSPSKTDSILRAKVAMEDKYSIFDASSTLISSTLFPPITGQISDRYNAEEKHFAIDITAPENTPVKAVADGTVIFAEWTLQTGYVLIIEHQNNLISVYKHNASLDKEQGDLVKGGEVIGSVGNTGSLTTGTHLHFELWSNGYPMNPANFIDFE